MRTIRTMFRPILLATLFALAASSAAVAQEAEGAAEAAADAAATVTFYDGSGAELDAGADLRAAFTVEVETAAGETYRFLVTHASDALAEVEVALGEARERSIELTAAIDAIVRSEASGSDADAAWDADGRFVTELGAVVEVDETTEGTTRIVRTPSGVTVTVRTEEDASATVDVDADVAHGDDPAEDVRGDAEAGGDGEAGAEGSVGVDAEAEGEARAEAGADGSSEARGAGGARVEIETDIGVGIGTDDEDDE